MEKDGLAFKNFLAILGENTRKVAKIPVGQFLALFKAAYPTISQTDLTLFTAKVGKGDVKNVLFKEVERLMQTYGKVTKVTPSQLLTFIANMSAQV